MKLKFILSSFVFLMLLLSSVAHAVDSNNCAINQSDLTGNLRFLATYPDWYQFNSTDNMPLKISLEADENRIFISFEKSEVVVHDDQPQFIARASAVEYVLWGEGPIKICPDGSKYKFEFLESSRVTASAHEMMRSRFRVGGQLPLELTVENGDAVEAKIPIFPSIRLRPNR
jgi:hypothetical protein